jgi:hypothetical protein
VVGPAARLPEIDETDDLEFVATGIGQKLFEPAPGCIAALRAVLQVLSTGSDATD